MRKFIFFLIFILTVQIQSFSQTVNTPSATSYSQNTSNQSASGFSLSNFNTSATLLVTIGLVNPPSGTTLTLSSYSGLTRSTGYNSWSNFTRISFTGTQSNINTALSNLKVKTGSVPGNVYIAVTATENPSGYYYLPSNGHFYRPMSWPSSGYSGKSATIYTNLLSLAAGQTFKGQTGYLVTITSQDEQNFIQANVPSSNILIALSDRNQEGVWKWDAGPEAGTTIKTSNNGGNVSGQYNNWCSGEPNNWSSGEDYAVTKWSGGNCWNDFGPPASSFPGSIGGYVVEFGTWSDPANQTFTNFYTGFVTHQIACSVAQTPSAPTAVNGSRNGTGTVTISATVPSGVTVDWYTSSSGGNPIVTGSSSYTTPSISSTTKYYAQARNSTTGCLSSTRTEVTASVSINETISGVVSVPNGLTLRPTLKLYLVENSNETLLQTVMVNTDGSYTLNPTTHNKTYKIVPSFTPILTMSDFDSVFYEAMNENTPDSQPVGVYLKTGQRLKSGDVDGNGKITIADAYLIAADISGLRELNGSYWYDNSSYSNLSKSNFQNNGSTSFTVNLGTTSQTLNIKYIGKGDSNLSESSE